jgi:LPS sulfotransferase NodH
MTTGFTSFVVFAEMRTGSNLLEANLNAIHGVTCHGEVFNPYFVGSHDRDAMFGIDIPARNADPLRMLAALRQGTEGLAGFRLFHDHDPRVTAAVLADPGCAKVILTRNPLESYVSLLIARETGQWRLQHGRSRKDARVTFDAAGFAAHLAEVQAFQIHLMRSLQVSGQAAFWIDYEDLGEIEVLNGLAAWLGVAGRLQTLDDRLKVQNPGALSDKVSNPQEMEAAVAALDLLNLSRTPNFEPRRPPAIPAWMAAGPLLFMPVQGGPVEAVATWLGHVGPIARDFTQRTLRDWRAPGQRSFTVLRHPAARARAAFRARVLSGARPDVWQAMVRDLKIALPPPGVTLTPDEEETALLGFLRFLRMNLVGQMPQKIDPAWASQAAVVQGFSTWQMPDAVLREDRMAAGLAWLCAETGIACPPCPVPPPPQNDSPAVMAAVREVYARDFAVFGF